MPIEIPMDSLKSLLEQEGKARPIAQGQTPPVNGRIITESLVKKIRIKRILEAARQEKVTVTERVILGILTGGLSETTREVIKLIPEKSDVIEIIDTGQTIVQGLIERFTETISGHLETRYVVHYTGNLKQVESLSMQGNKLYATVLFDWDIKADMLTPIPVGITIKGILNTKGVTAVKTIATISTGDDAKLNISLDPGGTKVEIRSLELAGVGLNLVDLIPLSASTSSTERILAEVVKRLPLHKYAQDLVDKSGDDRTFGQRIREAVDKEGRPILLRTNLFLDIAPSSLALGNVTGVQQSGKNYLILPVELKTPIRLVLSSKKPTPFPATNSAALPIGTTAQTRRLIDMQLIADVALDDLTALIDKAIRDVWGKNEYLSKGYDVAPSTIWESEDKKFVVRIPIRKKNAKKDWVVLYAWANIRVLEDRVGTGPQETYRLREVRLENVDWTEDSKNLLIKSLAWLAHEPLRQAIEKSGNLPLEKLEQQVREYGTQTHEDSILRVGFALKTHKFQDLTVSDGFLRIAFHLTGEPSFVVK